MRSLLLKSTWATKGDRIEGLRVFVKDLGVLQIARKETEEGSLMWDIRRLSESEITNIERRELTRSD